jgi:ATP-dependent Clp protease, protease subunit
MFYLDEEDPEIEEKNGSRPKFLEDRIDQALLTSRRLFICDPIDNASAKEVIRKLWYLEIKNPGKGILLVISSPGGSIDAGFAIWDQIRMISSPITTLVTGLAASMASVLTLVAPKGRRLATPNARFMIHQPAINGLVRGQATDLDIQAKEMLKMRATLINLYAQETGNDPQMIAKAIDRDTWMTAEEAKKFKHIDKIVTSFKEVGA